MHTLLLILLSWSPLWLLSYLATTHENGQLLNVLGYLNAIYGCLTAFALYDAVIKPRYKQREGDVSGDLHGEQKRKSLFRSARL